MNQIETQISNLDHLTDVMSCKHQIFNGHFTLDKQIKRGVEEKVSIVAVLDNYQVSLEERSVGGEGGGRSAMVRHQNKLWYAVDEVPKKYFLCHFFVGAPSE